MLRRSSIIFRIRPSVLAFCTGVLFANAFAAPSLIGQWENSSVHPPSLGNNRPSDSRSLGYADHQEPTESNAIYWSKSEFSIPFHVDASGKQPAEVQLEISTDGGASWSLYARDSLQSRQFRFASNQDGLYFFRIKTLDSAGQSYDPGGQPLKVYVDTKIPDLSLTIDTDAHGRMVADFTITDANPRVDSLRLEFQTEQNERWTAIPFETSRTANDVLSGRGIWEIPASARQLVVRLIAKDAAGNEAEVTRLPLLPKTALGMGGLQLASGEPGTRFGHSYPTSENIARSNLANPQPVKQSPSIATPSSPPASAAFGKPFASPPSISKPNLPTSLPSPVASMTSSMSRYPLQKMSSEASPTTNPVDKGEALYLDPTNSSTKPELGFSPGKSAMQPIDADRIEPPLGTAQSITDKPFYSKSKAFSLDYEVDGQAASPVASVELWGTTDGGRIWERWGTDPDGVSPFDIKVETDGMFGFRMVVVGANGLAGNRPRNGDNADAWIQVDTGQPMARIVSALYGKGVEANSLVIEFTAHDAFFGERPITLSYSEIPAGPWTTIATGLRNSGRFVWSADPTLPRRVYLKLDAHDEAGNVGEHRLDVPVDIEGLAPRGRIQGFRPISN